MPDDVVTSDPQHAPLFDHLKDTLLRREDQQKIGLGPYLAAMGGQAADGISTIHALKRGAVEQNPLIGQSPRKLMLAKGATAALIPVIMKLMEKAGHPTLGKVLGYGVGAFGGGLAAHNFSTVSGHGSGKQNGQ